jgi:hypothetical protein
MLILGSALFSLILGSIGGLEEAFIAGYDRPREYSEDSGEFAANSCFRNFLNVCYASAHL